MTNDNINRQKRKHPSDPSDVNRFYPVDSSNYLIHRDILRHQLSQKQGTVSTKTRSEVRGGGKKPWRQKGTGRARAGSSRSPLWKGGGVIFGPKPRTINLKLNKKERRLAIQALFCNKVKSKSIYEFEGKSLNRLKDAYGADLECIPPKTQAFVSLFKHTDVDLNENKTLLVVSKKTLPIKLATRNLKNVELISASHLNTLSLLKADGIIFTISALNEIKEILRYERRIQP